ncbi:MAG: DUF5009 domain-containing protein [Bacteroidetes bacterium]|nr:DUF5009 domain-containing protein [Bacteroidota bacterium]
MPNTTAPQRLLSLDFMRGLIMILLTLESTGLYEHLSENAEGGVFYPLTQQFFHHPWHGLRLWDLVQPAFMFMAGVAMALSLQKQQEKGMTWNKRFQKVLKRCAWLFFWGVLLYAVKRSGLSFELWNVLTQLSFTTLIAFLIFQWSVPAQIAVCAGLLIITEILYRGTNIPGFDQPFVDQHNFGNYVDWILMHKINKGGWVAINCIPTAVHTIGGALAGKVLLSKTHPIRTFLIGGLIAFVLGYALDLFNVTPIIKRIATTSFTLVSLGYSLWVLAACYWWIDSKGHRRHLEFFTIVGMNSIFIYLFFGFIGEHWLNGYVAAITGGLGLAPIIASLVIFACEWGLCYFLYRKKIFFRV